MHNSELFQFSIPADNSFNQTTLMEAQVGGATDTTTKPPIDNIPYLLLAPICFMIVWGIVVYIVTSDVWKFGKNSKLTLSGCQSVPCRTCRYFNKSQYLNCAVHPSIVLTKQARDCSDYCPNSSITEPESTDERVR